MVRFFSLLKRREGMSNEDFIKYYETHHSKLRITFPHDHVSRATGYRRSYIAPHPHPIGQATAGVDYDCILELIYPDREALDADMAFLSSDGVRPIFAEDEDQLFDRQYSRCYVVYEEHSSEGLPVSAVGAGQPVMT
ncbi:MAG: EthD domain-containing protein [Sphingomonadaceae bacterium]